MLFQKSVVIGQKDPSLTHDGVKKIRPGIIMVPQNSLELDNVRCLHGQIAIEAEKVHPDFTEVRQFKIVIDKSVI